MSEYVISKGSATCTESPTLARVGGQIHVTCPGCSLEYYTAAS